MNLQEIQVFINPDGRVRIEVRGAQGENCLDLTHDLEQALGGQVESRHMTSELYDSPAHEQDQETRQGGA